MSLKKPRVAIFGGDERVGRLEWPEHLDVRTYPYKSDQSQRQVVASAKSGSIDHLVLLTRYMGHGNYTPLRALDVPVIHWDRSPGALSREISTMIPEKPEAGWERLLRPTKPEENRGPGRGTLRIKVPTPSIIDVGPKQPSVDPIEVARALGAEILPHVTIPPPETFGQALRRILAKERLTGADLGRMIGKSQPVVSAWTLDKSMPRDMKPLVDLWPELCRFDKTRVPQARLPVKIVEELPIEHLDAIASIPNVSVHADEDALTAAMDAWKEALSSFRKARDVLSFAEATLQRIMEERKRR